MALASPRPGSSSVQKTKSMEPAMPRNIAERVSLSGGQCNHVRRLLMANRFTTSVAAIALIAGTSFAYAQGTGARESGGAAAQQSEHGGTAATHEHGGASSQMNHNSAQSGEKAQGGQRAQS